MKKKKSLLFVILFVLTFTLTGCGKAQDTSQVNIGYFNNITHAQALYMKATGALENALADRTDQSNLTVNWTSFNAGPAEVEALFAGSIDIGYIGPVPAVTANIKSQGDVVIISSATKGGAILVTRQDSGINSVSDLSGKTVAIPQIGNTQHLCLLKLLEDNNLADVNAGGDVTVTAVANADVANMMDQGNIDAALVPEPWGATLIGKGANKLLDYNEIYADGDYDVAVVVVRKDFLNAHPDVVTAFLEVHQQMTEKINADASSASVINDEIFRATEKSLSDDILEEAFARIGVSAELNRDSILGLAEVSLSQNIISKMPEEKTLFAEVP